MATAGQRYEERTGNIWSYAHRGDMTGLKAAVFRGVDVNMKNTAGWTACHAAAAGGQAKALRYLVKTCDADLRIPDRSGSLPVHQAAKNGHHHVLRILQQELGADLTEVRLSQARGKAVKDLLLEAYKRASKKAKRREESAVAAAAANADADDDNNNDYIDRTEPQDDENVVHNDNLLAEELSDHEENDNDNDDDDDDDVKEVGYARKQSRSTAMWGPRKTPISCKIKKKILKARRQRKKDKVKAPKAPKRGMTVAEEDAAAVSVVDDDDEDCGYESSVGSSDTEVDGDESFNDKNGEDVNTNKKATDSQDNPAEMQVTLNYADTVQQVKRNRKQKQKGRQEGLPTYPHPRIARVGNYGDNDDDALNKAVDEGDNNDDDIGNTSSGSSSDSSNSDDEEYDAATTKMGMGSRFAALSLMQDSSSDEE